jgi:hypothetical protein
MVDGQKIDIQSKGEKARLKGFLKDGFFISNTLKIII